MLAVDESAVAAAEAMHAVSEATGAPYAELFALRMSSVEIDREARVYRVRASGLVERVNVLPFGWLTEGS